MNQIKKDIIDEVLKKYPNYRSFETEHFIYWILDESYWYDGVSVSRNEFKYIKQYAAYNGTLPSLERNKIILEKENSKLYTSTYNSLIKLNPNTRSSETILRYSKTYDSIELYCFQADIRSPHRSNSNRLIVIKNRILFFSINKNGYVRVGKRWLSLKNIEQCRNMVLKHYITDRGINLLIYSMLGKYWATYLDRNIIVSNKNARIANSLEEAIILECGVRPSKILYKFFENDENALINLYKLIDSNKIHDIINFIRENKEEIIRLKNSFTHNQTFSLLICYFLTRDNRCDTQILIDYFKMALEHGFKINTKISSYLTLKRNHDELSRKILLKIKDTGQRLKINKIFPNIKSIDGLDVNRINTVKRLNHESAMLHHCVHSYKKQINQGQCAIYSLIYEGSAYTLQVGYKNHNVGKDDEYITLELKQLKGKYNSNSIESMKPLLENICQQNNININSINNLFFNRNSRENKKIIQIGRDILGRVSEYGNISRVFEQEPNPIEISPNLISVNTEEIEFDLPF